MIRKHRDTHFEIRFKASDPISIDEGRNRFLHGPAVVHCSNGDWVVTYQDSHDDPGRNSFIRQRRSPDGGKTWIDEGAIYDEDSKGFGARNPAFGMAPDGTLVLVVQRVGLKRLGKVRGENIVGSALLISEDCGRTYKNLGLVDSNIRMGHQGCSTHIAEHDGIMYMPAFNHRGLVLYRSWDGGRSWPERTVVIPEDSVPESPRYPTLAVRPDKSLLYLGHFNRAIQCFRRTGTLGNRKNAKIKWNKIEIYNDINLRHPVLMYTGDTLLCLGRNMAAWKTALCVSPDHGETWSDAIDVVPERGPGGGYTAMWPDAKNGGVFAVFSTDGLGFGAQDILGMFLSDFKIKRIR